MRSATSQPPPPVFRGPFQQSGCVSGCMHGAQLRAPGCLVRGCTGVRGNILLTGCPSPLERGLVDVGHAEDSGIVDVVPKRGCCCQRALLTAPSHRRSAVCSLSAFHEHPRCSFTRVVRASRASSRRLPFARARLWSQELALVCLRAEFARPDKPRLCDDPHAPLRELLGDLVIPVVAVCLVAAWEESPKGFRRGGARSGSVGRRRR